jgi:hypothetical protein
MASEMQFLWNFKYTHYIKNKTNALSQNDQNEQDLSIKAEDSSVKLI